MLISLAEAIEYVRADYSYPTALRTIKRLRVLARNRQIDTDVMHAIANTRQSPTGGNQHSSKLYCVNEHLMSGDNVLITAGRRVCRACQDERNAARDGGPNDSKVL